MQISWLSELSLTYLVKCSENVSAFKRSTTK